MLQLYELCRLCAQKKRHKLDLFQGLTDEEARILLAKISLCLSVNVTKEDLLPKMICFDCQKTVEQFNAFRIKCHKAEERLNKMLSIALPNKASTRIKQECLESDFHDINIQLKVDSPKCNETFINLKSVSNVKSEIDDVSNEGVQSSELIKIISEEMVNQHELNDIKQPHIEIISENFNEEFKNSGFFEDNQFYSCDIKIIPDSLIRQENINITSFDLNSNNEINSTFIADIKEQTREKARESVQDQTMSRNSTDKLAKINKKGNQGKNTSNEESVPEDEPEEKFLTLKEGEVCDIDLEEMDALIKKKQNPNYTFQCNICNKLFKFFKCFRKHKQWHNSQPDVFICDFCKNENASNFEFTSLKSLNNHIQRKHLSLNLKKFKCSICSRSLPSLGQLKAHCKKVHDESGATCQTCGKKFKNHACLNSHSKVHQEDRPYVCDFCGQTFKWSNALKVHIIWHKQEKNFLCSECGKKFTTKKNLMEHLNIHSGKRPYTCESCNASFTQFSAFSKHLYLHNESSRIHKCDKCKITFSHAYMLKQHLIRHTGLRPFKCSTCHSCFKSQSDLRFHSKIHMEKQYGCHVCGRKFAASKTLRDHMVRHTGIKHICPVPECGKSYTQRFSLTKHFSKQHPLLSIVKKKSGRRTHTMESSKEEQLTDSDFIRYDFEEKELNFG